jgi:hypothetical protein
MSSAEKHEQNQAIEMIMEPEEEEVKKSPYKRHKKEIKQKKSPKAVDENVISTISIGEPPSQQGKDRVAKTEK